MMRLLAIFCLLSAAIGVGSAQDVLDPKPDAPQATIGDGKVTYVLPDIDALRGFDFLNAEPKCNGTGVRRRQNPNDATALLQEGVAFLSQTGSDGSLADIYYQAAEVIQLPSLPLFVIDAQNQALAQLIAWAANNMVIRIHYVNPAVLPTLAHLTISALIISCFNTKRTSDSLRRFDVPTQNNNFQFSNYCPPDNLAPLCSAIELCNGSNGVCTADFMKGCKCTTPQACPTPDIRPFCENCGGTDPNGLCNGVTGPTGTTNIYKGCECFPDLDSEIYTPWSDDASFSDALNQAQQIFVGGGTNGPNPKCNGVSTNTYAAEAAVTQAVKDFCSDQGNLHGNQDTTTSKSFNNKIKLTIYWPTKSGGDFSNWDISTDECQKDFGPTVSGCDGNDAVHNPADLKHGGVYRSDAGLKYTYQPLKGDPFEKSCNGWDSGQKAFMKPDILKQNVLDVCAHAAQFATGGKEGQYSNSYNSNTDDAAFLKVAWAAGTSLSADNCVNDMSELNSGCDGDPILNQFDFKWGGEKGSPSLFYQVSPLTSRMPITSGGNRGDAGNGRSRGTTGKDGKTIDKAVLQMCLAGYGDQGWDGLDCAGVMGFYKGHYSSWNSPQDCHWACVNSLSKLIDDGVNSAYCNHCVNGVAVCCWEGFEF